MECLIYFQELQRVGVFLRYDLWNKREKRERVEQTCFHADL